MKINIGKDIRLLKTDYVHFIYLNKNVYSDILEEWGGGEEATNCSNVNLRLVSKGPLVFLSKYKLMNFGSHYFILPISRLDYEELLAEQSSDSQQMYLNCNKITKAHGHEDTHQTMSSYIFQTNSINWERF